MSLIFHMVIPLKQSETMHECYSLHNTVYVLLFLPMCSNCICLILYLLGGPFGTIVNILYMYASHCTKLFITNVILMLRVISKIPLVCSFLFRLCVVVTSSM